MDILNTQRCQVWISNMYCNGHLINLLLFILLNVVLVSDLFDLPKLHCRHLTYPSDFLCNNY